MADGDSDDHLPRDRKKLVSSRRAKFMTSVKDLNADINISAKAVAMDMTDLGRSDGALSITGQDEGTGLKLLPPTNRAGVSPGNGPVLDLACSLRPGRTAGDEDGNKKQVLSGLTFLPTKAMITIPTRPSKQTGLLELTGH